MLIRGVVVEFATLHHDATGRVVYKLFKPNEIEELLKEEGVFNEPAERPGSEL